MNSLRRHSSTLALLLFWSAAYAYDSGQYDNVDPAIRQWFQSVRSHQGIPCCSIADGHPTAWRGTPDGGYEVPIDGIWQKVPEEAIVRNAGNPTGEAIVWYVRQGNNPVFIRCFVAGPQG